MDGSGWEGVYKALKKDGYAVTIVQNPTISLADDVAVTKRALAAQNGPVILVGHSYGGAVITEAGSDPKVAALVYIAAFAPDKGESVKESSYPVLTRTMGRRLRVRPGTARARIRSEVEMPTLTVETELLELENQYWQAIKERDVDTAMKLIDFPCLVAGATGIGRVDREAFIKMMKGASYRLHEFEIKDSEVRLLKDDVALVAYKVHEDLTVDGEKVSMDAADSSVWVRRNDQWRCALHTESLAGDPYGRDRK